NIIASDFFKNAKHIACYFDVKGEVSSKSLIEKIWQEGKHCYLPAIDNGTMKFMHYVSNTELKKNRYGINEPVLDEPLVFPPEKLDCVFVPLVAFNSQGDRIGMGAGYYDKTFAFLNKKDRVYKPLLIGLAYEFQKTDVIDTNDWDVKLNRVITEKQDYICRG
ncbi:MAG: 5-formyltetrahydrofolate cyclo-ligase, partial [Gammaproteobacteria bacterium]